MAGVPFGIRTVTKILNRGLRKRLLAKTFVKNAIYG